MANGSPILSDQQLKTGYWYATHREQVRRAGMIALACLGIGMLGFSITRLIILVTIEEPRFRASLGDVRQQSVRASAVIAPLADLEILDAATFPAGEGRYDFVARVRNPNTRYAAKIHSAFAHDLGSTHAMDIVVLPGQEMIVSALALELPQSPGNAQLVIESREWTQVVGWERLAAERLRLQVQEITQAPLSGVSSQGIALSFTLVNDSAYGLWTVDVPVVLLRGSTMVGVHGVRLADVHAGEMRPVTIQWFGAPVGATEVLILPYVNILDPKVVQPVSAGESGTGR